MGLRVSHGCFDAPHGAFHRFRCAVAALANIPLPLMEGFYQPDPRHPLLSEPYLTPELRRYLPIRWETLKPDVLHELLNHSDCDGHIGVRQCKPLADRLDSLLPMVPDLPANRRGIYDDLRKQIEQFSEGLRLAHETNANIEFHG